MINFKDLNIQPTANKFIGDKIPVKKLLGAQIKVIAFKIEPSKKKEGTDLLTLQIEKSNGEMRIVFTGSKGLMAQIRQVPADKFPFMTTIVDTNDYYEFT